MLVLDPPLVEIRSSPFISNMDVEITTDDTLSDGGVLDNSSTWSIDSLGVSTSRGAYTSWEDVRVELVTIPYGPGRSPDNSSDPNSDSDGSGGGLEELTSFLLVIRDRLIALLWDPGNMTYWGWASCIQIETYW